MTGASQHIQAAALIPAAGQGLRMGGPVAKQYMHLAGRPILLHTLDVFDACDRILHLIVVVPPDQVHETEDLVRGAGYHTPLTVTGGGAERQDSVSKGLDVLPAGMELVAVHDGVRPLVSGSLIRRVLDAASVHGAAIPGLPVKDTIKAVQDGRVTGTQDRSRLMRIQTPQAFHTDRLRQALAEAAAKRLHGTDDAALVEAAGFPVVVVPGEETNFKITDAQDLMFAEIILKQRMGTCE